MNMKGYFVIGVWKGHFCIKCFYIRVINKVNIASPNVYLIQFFLALYELNERVIPFDQNIYFRIRRNH